MRYIAMIATAVALLCKLVLVTIGFFVVPFTSQSNPVWGNDEESAPDWFAPGWKEMLSCALTAGILCGIVSTSLLVGVFAFAWSLFFAGNGKTGRDYLWRAWRNPANNVRFLFEQPEHYNLYGRDNPERSVRDHVTRKAQRWIWVGPYFEYWRVWRTEDNLVAELRVGWKFSPVPGFAPTLQYRKGA